MLGQLLATAAALGFDSGAFAFVDVTEETTLLVKHHRRVMLYIFKLQQVSRLVICSPALQI